jgi:SAM-dependent methyltransferase
LLSVTELELLELVRAKSVHKGYWDNPFFDWRLSHFPDRLEGCVLEVGTHEGFFGFLAELRGAKEVQCVENKPLFVNSCRETAQQIGSNCQVHDVSICELQIDQKFDFTLFVDVYYHIEDPMAALRMMRKFTKLQMMFGGCFLVDQTEPLMYCLEEYEYNPQDATNIWIASMPCLHRMLYRVGFKTQHLISTKQDRFLMYAS